MPVPLPNLDDRTFADLVDELRTLIPLYSERWTDHNVSDPGIMLLELFAWLTEATLYRIDRVPEASRVRLLELLGATFEPADPAYVGLSVSFAAREGCLRLPKGTLVEARSATGDEVLPFETVRDVCFTPDTRRQSVVVRQTQAIEETFTATGHDLQSLALAQRFIALPDAPTPRHPEVVVEGETWQHVDCLESAHRSAQLFIFRSADKREHKPYIEFGDGEHGKRPKVGVEILVKYHSDPSGALVTDEFTGTGRPQQRYRLSMHLLPPSDLEPQLWVDDTPWTYRSHILDLAGKTFCVESWRNAVRFGNGDRGHSPPKESKIKVTYRVTAGRRDNLAPQTQFSIAGHTNDLRVVRFHTLSHGADRTSIDDARLDVYGILKPLWRAVTRRDFEQLILDNLVDVGRAHCVPGYALRPFVESSEGVGHVSIISVPRPRHTLTTPVGTINEIVGCAPDGRRLVASDTQGNVSLWNMETGDRVPFRGILPRAPTTDQTSLSAVFSPDGKRLVTITRASTRLWDATTGDYLSRLPMLPDDFVLRFSPDSRRLAGVCGNEKTVWIWDAEIGSRGFLARRPPASTARVVQLLFSPDARCLAIVDADDADISRRKCSLWDPETGKMTYELELDGVRHALFSADSRSILLINDNDDNDDNDCTVHVNDVTTGQRRIQFQVDHSIDGAAFLSNSARLLAYGHGKRVTLWSTRSGKPIAKIAEAGQPLKLCTSPNHRLIAVWPEPGSEQSTIADVWDVRKGIVVAHLRHDYPVRAAVFDEAGQRIGTLSGGDNLPLELRFWDVRLRYDPQVSRHCFPALAAWIADANGRWLALVDKSLVHIWDISTGLQTSSLYVDLDNTMDSNWKLAIPESENGNTHIIPVDSSVKATRLITARGSLLFAWSDGQRVIQVWNAAYCEQCKRLLEERRLIASQTHCMGPRYTDVYVDATVFPVNADLQAKVRTALLQFFHPLHGGPDRAGWPLGRPVYPSEVFEAIEAVPGVDHVEGLRLGSHEIGTTIGAGTAISIPPYHLVNCVVEPDANMV